MAKKKFNLKVTEHRKWESFNLFFLSFCLFVIPKLINLMLYFLDLSVYRYYRVSSVTVHTGIPVIYQFTMYRISRFFVPKISAEYGIAAGVFFIMPVLYRYIGL